MTGSRPRLNPSLVTAELGRWRQAAGTVVATGLNRSKRRVRKSGMRTARTVLVLAFIVSLALLLVACGGGGGGGY